MATRTAGTIRRTAFNLGAPALAALVLSACGGSQPPAETPSDDTALLQQSSDTEETTPPSSEGVKAGQEAIEAGDYAKAEEILAAEVKANPDDAQASYYYALTLEAQEKFDPAVAAYERTITLNDKLLEAPQNLANLLLDLERDEDALKVAEAGLKIAPQYPPLLAARAAALDMLGRDECIQAYLDLLEVAPEDGANRYNLAVVLASKDRKEDALAQLDQLKSQDDLILADAADLYGRLGAFEKCVGSADKALKVRPSALAYVYRARCKMGLKDSAGAEADLKSAVDTEKDNAIGYFYLGKHLVVSGKVDEGKAMLEKAVELGPDTPFGQAAAVTLKKL